MKTIPFLSFTECSVWYELVTNVTFDIEPSEVKFKNFVLVLFFSHVPVKLSWKFQTNP